MRRRARQFPTRAFISRACGAAVTSVMIAALGALLVSSAVASAAPKPRAAAHRTDVIPVNVALLRPPLASYRRYAANELQVVASRLSTLLASEQAGDFASAEHDWLPAHLAWLRIGQDDGAYGAFGNLGRQIDGTAAGRPGGVAAKSFTGFHRVEYELWTARDLPAALTATEQLRRLISKLQSIGMRHELAGNATAVQNWVLRAHEVLEDADRDTLSADDDYGSATGVASVIADASATRELLKLLEPVLDPRAPKLVRRADGDIARIDRVAKATRVEDHWVAVSSLPRASREHLDAAVDGALSNLAPISDIIRVSGAVS